LQLNATRPGLTFEVLSNPEFLAEGEAVKNLLDPDRILIGSSKTNAGHAAASALASIYHAWVSPARIQLMSSTSAELAKLAANAMLAQRLSSINAISTMCEASGANMADVQRALGSDSRIGAAYLQPGIGFGGSCFKKDVLSLVHIARTLHLPEIGNYWLQTLLMNHFQSRHFAQRVVRRLDGELSDKKVAIFGWSFKKGTSDSRETRSVRVIKELLKESVKEIAIFDPGCDPAGIREEVASVMNLDDEVRGRAGKIIVHDDPYRACEAADAIVILTDWDHFRCVPGSGRAALGWSGHARTGDAAESASYSPLRTDNAHSEVDNLLSKLCIRDHDGTPDRNDSPTNFWARMKSEPPCPPDCKECNTKSSVWGSSNDLVDWKRISEIAKSPRWVFDGRNCVDSGEMERLGFRVEMLGRASHY
jgi:UDPglucose 6-dehydrogenase